MTLIPGRLISQPMIAIDGKTLDIADVIYNGHSVDRIMYNCTVVWERGSATGATIEVTPKTIFLFPANNNTADVDVKAHPDILWQTI